MTQYHTKTLPHPGKAFLNLARQQTQMQNHRIEVASTATVINSTY